MKKLFAIFIIVFLLSAVKEKITPNENDILSFVDYYKYYSEKITLLANKHSGQFVSCSEEFHNPQAMFNILDKNIIIDSVVIGRYKKNENYFLKAKSFSSDAFAFDLKCSRETYLKLNNIKGKHYLLAIKTNKVQSAQRIVEIDSLDKKCLFLQKGNETVVYGECIDAEPLADLSLI